MRFIILIILYILMISPTYIHANRSNKDSSLVEYNKDGLKILCFFIDSEQFFEEWAKPEPPHISTVSSAIRGDSIFPVILYGTDGVDENGNAFLTYDITILRPDGTVYGEYSDLNICKDKPSDNIHMYLLEQPILIIIEDQDPIGNYAVNVVIHEKNKKVRVPLSLSFNVVEIKNLNSKLGTLTSIKSHGDLSLFIDEYYISPRPDLVTEALIFISDSVLLQNENAIPPMYGFFTQLFFQFDTDLKPWEIIAEQHVSLQGFLSSAVEASRNPKESFRREPLTPSLNDMYWGAFFASGDPYFIREITKHLKYLDERNELLLFLLGATAEWSLSSNARIRSRVKADLLLIKENSEPQIVRRIELLLEKTPEQIRQEMQDIIKKQMDMGVWE